MGCCLSHPSRSVSRSAPNPKWETPRLHNQPTATSTPTKPVLHQTEAQLLSQPQRPRQTFPLDPALRITITPYTHAYISPQLDGNNGDISPISADSISFAQPPAKAKVNRTLTTSGIRQRYRLPPRKRGVEVPDDEAFRE